MTEFVGVQGGLRLTPGAFFSNWLATMLVTLVAQSFGLLIGATVMDAKTAQTVTAVIMLTMMLVRSPWRPFWKTSARNQSQDEDF